MLYFCRVEGEIFSTSEKPTKLHTDNSADLPAPDVSKVGIQTLLEENSLLKDEINRKVAQYETRLSEADVELSSLKSQLTELMGVYDDLQDRLYEIDRSWQNNLIFYGVKPDYSSAGNQAIYESQECIEQKVKAILRNNLNIGREIPIQRAQRIYNGSDVRGFKPVVVNFQVSL